MFVHKKFAQLLLVLTLVVTIGGHWAVLQSVAWVGMAVSYSKDAPLAEALVKTFDGNHPCALCKAVNAGKQAEQKQATLKSEIKIDWCVTRDTSLLDAPMPFTVISGKPVFALPRAESPPTPPPRSA